MEGHERQPRSGASAFLRPPRPLGPYMFPPSIAIVETPSTTKTSRGSTLRQTRRSLLTFTCRKLIRRLACCCSERAVMRELKDAMTSHPMSAPINATRANKILTIMAAKVLDRFKSCRIGPCCKLPFGLILKFGKRRYPAEAHTIRYIAENTNIPVPKVYCAFTRE